jgi:hypothetical protein
MIIFFLKYVLSTIAGLLSKKPKTFRCTFCCVRCAHRMIMVLSSKLARWLRCTDRRGRDDRAAPRATMPAAIEVRIYRSSHTAICTYILAALAVILRFHLNFTLYFLKESLKKSKRYKIYENIPQFFPEIGAFIIHSENYQPRF